MKILVYIPMAPTSPRVWSQTIEGVMAMDWDGPVDIVFGREDVRKQPLPAHYLNLTEKYNRARALVLADGYDAMLTVESDMVVPPLTLKRLTQVEADVAYGLYCSRRHGHQWLAMDRLDIINGISLSRDKSGAREAWGQIIETSGVGMGCTLIQRRVLEAIPFRCPEPDLRANDWDFALDVSAAGFVQKHDCGVVCGHIDQYPTPRIYWPDPDAEGLYRTEML